jgi:hypothetical protein
MISIDRRRLNRELNRLLGPQAMSRAASCGATIAVRARDKVLVFLTRGDVEATNNGSERALPPLGDLPQSAKVYADLRAVVAACTALTVIATVPEPQRTAVPAR